MGQLRSECNPLQQPLPAACLSRTATSPSASSDTGLSVAAWGSGPSAFAQPLSSIFLSNVEDAGGAADHRNRSRPPNLELQLLTKASSSFDISGLQLSIGSSEIGDKTEMENANDASGGRYSPPVISSTSEKWSVVAALKEEAQEQLRAAMAEKAYAEEARSLAKRQREAAEQEFSNAKRIRQQATAELEKAQTLKDQAAKQLSATILQITCYSCKQRFRHETATWRPAAFTSESMFSADNSVGLDYISAALREWEVKQK